MDRSIKVGLAGTGYAAKQRVEALQQMRDRASVVAIAGRNRESRDILCDRCGAKGLDSWQELLQIPEIDLIIIATINCDHGTIALAALEADKNVICEYPLSLDPREARTIVELARSRRQFLHVEHIEILGGLHQTMREVLPQIGEVNYARYITIKPKHPTPVSWSYRSDRFGFPFSAALSRIHRFTDLFGSVQSVSGYSRFWQAEESNPYYTACLCKAQLCFANGLIADLVYGKGDRFWQSTRTFELHGSQGTLIFSPEGGELIRDRETTAIKIGSRRGLFARDTTLALDGLLTGKPLYISPESSYYALLVADTIRQSTESGQTIEVKGILEG
ncbi:MAG: Gfo/Idh/MocA family oxidoreductase [Cyanobacteria bacterium SBLK]|nr:Gfo/Idh/MocA family oxidoreductase [Cyanobacteria bacterium SBLK]